MEIQIHMQYQLGQNDAVKFEGEVKGKWEGLEGVNERESAEL